MNILFVCSGNTCRSPMAEGYLKSRQLPDVFVKSRGFLNSGDSVSENSVAALAARSIDISAHLSSCITPEDIAWSDKIICMSQCHLDALSMAGTPAEKLSVLGGGIADPFGQSQEVYNKTAQSIIAAIDQLIFGGVILPFSVAPAEKGDFTEIARLEEASFSQPWSENALLESFSCGTRFFCAKHNGLLAGYMGLSAVAGEGYVTNVAVFPQYKRMGVASLLLCFADSFAAEQGLEFISLEVRPSNIPAISLYSKHGYEKVGQRKNFYDNPKEDADIMTRRFKF